jgi:hypothetical protein
MHAATNTVVLPHVILLPVASPAMFQSGSTAVRVIWCPWRLPISEGDMIIRTVVGNISREATTPVGNIHREAMRHYVVLERSIGMPSISACCVARRIRGAPVIPPRSTFGLCGGEWRMRSASA